MPDLELMPKGFDPFAGTIQSNVKDLKNPGMMPEAGTFPEFYNPKVLGNTVDPDLFEKSPTDSSGPIPGSADVLPMGFPPITERGQFPDQFKQDLEDTEWQQHLEQLMADIENMGRSIDPSKAELAYGNQTPLKGPGTPEWARTLGVGATGPEGSITGPDFYNALHPQQRRPGSLLDWLVSPAEAMADLPPPPTSGEGKRLADPIRPQPLAPKPDLSRIQEIRGRLKELDQIETGLQRSGPDPYRQPRDETWVDRRTLRGAMPEEDLQRLREMVGKGMTQKQISEALGIGDANVGRKIRAMREKGEIEKRGRFWFREPEHMERFKGLVNQGLSQQAIAKEMGINVATVNDLIKEFREPGQIGGKRIPSMPQFKFQDKAPEGDEDYEKELRKFLKDIKAFFMDRQRNQSMTG